MAPPPAHAVRARRVLPLPLLGVVAMVCGVYIAAQAVRATSVTKSGKRARHSKKTTAAEAAKLVAAWVVGIVAGIGVLWWSKTFGLWSLAGLGIGILGPSVLMTPFVAAELKSAFGGPRRRRLPMRPRPFGSQVTACQNATAASSWSKTDGTPESDVTSGATASATASKVSAFQSN